MSSTTLFETTRLQVRNLANSDFDAFHEMQSNDEVRTNGGDDVFAAIIPQSVSTMKVTKSPPDKERLGLIESVAADAAALLHIDLKTDNQAANRNDRSNAFLRSLCARSQSHAWKTLNRAFGKLKSLYRN